MPLIFIFKKRIFNFIIVAFICFFIGCSGFQTLPECDISIFKKVEIPNTPILPSKDQFNDKNITAIVADFDCNNCCNEPKGLTILFKNLLQKNLMAFGVNIYEGTKRKELIDAAKRNEILMKRSHYAPSIINYVFFGNIYSVEHTINHIEGIKITKDGMNIKLPDTCEIAYFINASIDVYDGITAQIKKKIEIMHKYVIKVKTKKSNCRSYRSLAKAKQVDACRDAFEKEVKHVIGNIVTPVAYVLELGKKPSTEEKIVRVSCGSKKLNFQARPIAEFYRVKQRDLLGDQKEIFSEKIASGTFCKNSSGPKSSWVYIDNSKTSIMKYDMVKVKYEKLRPSIMNELFCIITCDILGIYCCNP